MSIITVSKIKGLLNLTDTSKDSFIENNLPAAIEFLFTEFHNYFEVATDQIYIEEADTISFESGTPAKIKDSANGLVEAGFKAGMAVRIKGSYLNEKVVELASVTSGEMTLTSDYTLDDENFGLEISLTIIKLPEVAKLFVAKLIESFFPNKSTTQGIESERFDDYSVKFNKQEIPQQVLDIMEPKRKLSWG